MKPKKVETKVIPPVAKKKKMRKLNKCRKGNCTRS